MRGAVGRRYSTTGNRPAAQDTEALFALIDSRKDVAGKKIGTTGYCMGGGISLTVAGSLPDRIAAAASFHGGNLASDAEDSPHLLAPKIKAKVYVAGADQDNSYPPEMAAKLEQVLTNAEVDHRCEIYEGASHGWTMADFPIYNESAAERHWRELLDLFRNALG